jgi:transposase
MEVCTIGLGLAKTVFQAHGVDAGSRVIIKERLRRSELID